ncbi:T-cell leukemia/lymphoma protein 1A-like [Eptesicus fuscus]|uniref:T-cell leukemia/lymphoma protein 1A-like n=1 Tax=Eptesicus fuscus TaxID=29078 RepID=UPI002403B4BE|nr:T-cell leukemia/lymphoma protein 1A-like [Eptesicus fuscus]
MAILSHPERLSIRGPSVYEDQARRTWLPLVTATGGLLQVRLRQVDVPPGHIVLPSPLPPTSMPWGWALHPGGRYLDAMGQFWRIVSHVGADGREEMVLELLPGP